jgi:hypothetical protein
MTKVSKSDKNFTFAMPVSSVAWIFQTIARTSQQHLSEM